MRPAAAIVIWVSFAIGAWAQFTSVVPADRHIAQYWGTNWQGVQWDYKAIANRVLYTNLSGLDGTGATDVSTAINNAIANAYNAAPTCAVVYLPAGTYRCDNQLTLNRNNVVVQGDTNANARTVILYNQGGQYGWDFGNDINETTGLKLFSGFTKGSSNVTMIDLDSYAVGDVLWIGSTNDTNVCIEISNFTNLFGTIDVGCMTRITSVSQSSNLTIWPPLAYDFKASLGPQARHWPASVIRTNSGIESLVLDSTGTNRPSFCALIMHQLYGCWLDSVTVTNQGTLGVIHDDSVQDTVTHCTFTHIGSGVANSGVGYETFHYCGWGLVEDCLADTCFQGIQLDYGSTANAFLYCAVINSSNQCACVADDFNVSHGAGNIMNLIEGCEFSRGGCDPTHGSASLNTFFRCWARADIAFKVGGSPTNMSSGFAVGYGSRSNNFVGNVIGTDLTPISIYHAYEITNGAAPDVNLDQYTLAYSFGCPNQGNRSWNSNSPPFFVGGEYDLMVASNSLRKANHLMGKFAPWTNQIPTPESIGSTNLESSLFRPAKPAYFTNWAWPPFGSDLTTKTNMLPAIARWFKIAQPAGTSTNTAPSRIRGIRRI